MPDKDVKTICDQIYFQYAKLIARSAFGCEDGKRAKKECYGFIKNTFKQLKNGEKNWSDIVREDWQLVESEKKCAYCGTVDNLHREHIVPKSVAINERCGTCDAVQSIHNQVWACGKCNSEKGAKGLYEFYKAKLAGEKKFYDFLPALVEKKYLKTMYNCHVCAGTLDKGDIDGDGTITTLDIDFILHRR